MVDLKDYVKICKFGGSSVANEPIGGAIKKIIENDSKRQLIVVSAPGKDKKYTDKITDVLIKASLNKKFFDYYMKYIENRFQEFSTALSVDINLKKEIRKIKYHYRIFKNKSYLISRGEYLTAKIFAKYLKIDFIDASKIIKFNKNGKIKNKTYKVIAALLKKHKRILIPGFYGSNIFGKIKVMSRGGSDITGAICAKAINNSIYENWTDVDGVYNCFEDKSKLFSYISYDDLQFLSFYGASVLNYKCANICKDRIVIIKNTFNYKQKGTIVYNFGKQIEYAKTKKQGIELVFSENFMIDKLIKKARVEVLCNTAIFNQRRLIIAINKGYSNDKIIQSLIENAKQVKQVELCAYISKDYPKNECCNMILLSHKNESYRYITVNYI